MSAAKPIPILPFNATARLDPARARRLIADAQDYRVLPLVTPPADESSSIADVPQWALYVTVAGNNHWLATFPKLSDASRALLHLTCPLLLWPLSS
jgi:hypothetical protein